MTSNTSLKLASLGLCATFLLSVGCSSGGTAKMCSVAGKTYSVGATFSDGCNGCTCGDNGITCTTVVCITDGGQDGASADVGAQDVGGDTSDAAPKDGAADTASDGGLCALPGTYRFGAVGGLVAFSDESTISPPAQYLHVRTRGRGGDGAANSECSPAFPACGAQDAISVLDLVRDLADAAVVAAFAQATPPLFGVDSRPVDGQVYSVLRADGHGVLVGSPCGAPAVDCHAIPHGVQVLVDHLKALDTAQLAKAECAAVRAP